MSKVSYVQLTSIIRDVRHFAEKNSVQLILSPETNGIEIIWIKTMSEQRGMGYKVISRLIEHADRHFINLRLYAILNKVEYYERLGFVVVHRDDDGIYMVRNPKLEKENAAVG